MKFSTSAAIAARQNRPAKKPKPRWTSRKENNMTIFKKILTVLEVILTLLILVFSIKYGLIIGMIAGMVCVVVSCIDCVETFKR